MDTLTELSLFTGYGGLSLGLRLAGVHSKVVCYVENEPYCQEIIKARAAEGHLDDAPIWDDVRTFHGRPWRGAVDIITAGFPCQPHSTAGKCLGSHDSRNLWPDTLRVIGEVGPRWALLENVAGISYGGRPYAATVAGELAEIGYDTTWHFVSAASVGAPHLRWRWWCLAYPQCESSEIRGDDRPDADISRTRKGDHRGSRGDDRRELNASPHEPVVPYPTGGGHAE